MMPCCSKKTAAIHRNPANRGIVKNALGQPLRIGISTHSTHPKIQRSPEHQPADYSRGQIGSVYPEGPRPLGQPTKASVSKEPIDHRLEARKAFGVVIYSHWALSLEPSQEAAHIVPFFCSSDAAFPHSGSKHAGVPTSESAVTPFPLTSGCLTRHSHCAAGSKGSAVLLLEAA